MKKADIKLDKPFGVIVTVGGKTVLKQFDIRDEAEAFGYQLDEHKNVEYEILERPTRGVAGRPYSDAYIAIKTDRVPGGVWYKCVPVRQHKGYLFCTNCHDYKKFHKEKDEYGSVFNCCPDCGLPDTDSDVKTANGLWKK